jgi:hypothetical protein
MRVVIVVLALAFFPATAVAKEVSRVDVCGSDGCGRITDHQALQGFMEGDDVAAEVPYGPQRSYLLKVYVRNDQGEPVHGWTTNWVPKTGVLAFEDPPGQFNFTAVPAELQRALRGAARGRTARAARTFAHKVEPEAQVDEVVPSPAATARADGGGGSPPFAWIGVAVGLLLVGGGAVRARRG